ncbi:hypothetical protein B2J93_6996 [Marssonina coronariae]|uniref:Mitochondrial intermediate peptidase n=1 Tax=Diplocarpon coronariae TaxID=2795749 RepID=A0A218ZBH9_9HELO|nr:hypothetical protein B2J93_6996 [Marssonina coronariae]
MFKSSLPRSWVCSRCIRRRLPSSIRRNHVQAVSPTFLEDPVALGLKASAAHIAIDTAASASRQEDQILGKIFDSTAFWGEFSQSSKSGSHVGLFQNRYLTTPEGFRVFAHVSLQKAKGVVATILAASTSEEYAYMVKNLERLSDLLCRVIDLADFVKATHPDFKTNQAAAKAYSMMYEYMNVLNTTTGLAQQLDIATEYFGDTWSEEEQLVAAILKRDFAKSAIDLPQGDKEKFVSLSQEIAEVDFVERMEPEKKWLSFKSSKLYGMDPVLVKEFTKCGIVTLPTIGEPASAALHAVQDEDVRKQLFIASRTASKSTLRRLHTLLTKRAELAKLSKFESYAHMSLEDKMAKAPEAVNGFLEELSKDNKSQVQSCMIDLLAAKQSHRFSSRPHLEPWDKEFYMAQLLASVPSRLKTSDVLSSYFSVGRVMQGISRLFTRLYGVRLVPRENLAGETWNPDVRTLDVISEADGHVAVLYCDLFARSGKSPNPAHFTIRCSRQIRDKEIEEAAAAANPIFSSAEESANDGMAITRACDGTVMQLPIIALICNFATSLPGSKKPSLLSFNEVTTLFHEMGHAIHSILGRTKFQEVSGTRCATDFAELPSIMMEHFAADPAVLALFATHYETDQPLPYEMVAEKLALDQKFEGVDTENQLILSLLDQVCHSSAPLDPSFNSSEAYRNLQRTHGVMPEDPAGTSWEGFFGHLYGYGGSYYSYLFDRVLAERIWQKVFLAGSGGASLDRLNGENFKNEVLKWGGARDPWKCLAGVLKDERVESGGKEAMQIVGSWGVERRRKMRERM